MKLQLEYSIEFPFDTFRYVDQRRSVGDWGIAHMVLLRFSLNGRGHL